jgi:hypothetical protein
MKWVHIGNSKHFDKAYQTTLRISEISWSKGSQQADLNQCGSAEEDTGIAAARQPVAQDNLAKRASRRRSRLSMAEMSAVSRRADRHPA